MFQCKINLNIINSVAILWRKFFLCVVGLSTKIIDWEMQKLELSVRKTFGTFSMVKNYMVKKAEGTMVARKI